MPDDLELTDLSSEEVAFLTELIKSHLQVSFGGIAKLSSIFGLFLELFLGHFLGNFSGESSGK